MLIKDVWLWLCNRRLKEKPFFVPLSFIRKGETRRVAKTTLRMREILSAKFYNCVTDLDSRSEMIIFESILSTFELSVIFWSSRGNSENRLEPKIETPLANFASTNP